MILDKTADYRLSFYERYVSAFKGRTTAEVPYEFTDSKLIPLIRDWLAELDREAPCIDLGCGGGSLLHALQGLGFTRLAGIDVSAEQVALAQRVTEHVAQGDLLAGLQRQPDAHFGAIFLFDVIEHLTKHEILALLEMVCRKLRPGGLFICHCPNGDSPFVGNILAGDYTHETLLNASSAGNLCALFGLRDFEARENLGASAGLKGWLRGGAWQGVRLGLKLVNLIETGAPGSNVFTRQFCFKARKA